MKWLLEESYQRENRRSPCGERGLKSQAKKSNGCRRCRSPCGERGLKSLCVTNYAENVLSLPVRGAWIEIPFAANSSSMLTSSLPVRGAWIEIIVKPLSCLGGVSLPVRGAWIEICPPKEQEQSAASLPVRGAWIEIDSSKAYSPPFLCRSPCGERGLKSHATRVTIRLACRSPCGERGLKCGQPRKQMHRACKSLPVRGAWIEM